MAWPSIRRTTFTLAPADIANDAVVWRNPWGTNPSIPISAQARSNARRYSSMGRSPPRWQGNTKALGSSGNSFLSGATKVELYRCLDGWTPEARPFATNDPEE